MRSISFLILLLLFLAAVYSLRYCECTYSVQCGAYHVGGESADAVLPDVGLEPSDPVGL